MLLGVHRANSFAPGFSLKVYCHFMVTKPVKRFGNLSGIFFPAAVG